VNSFLDIACNRLQVTPSQALTEGGQKQVYVVSDSKGSTSVLKPINLSLATDPAARKRAEREVDILKRVHHPNVVSVRSDLIFIGDPPVAVSWLEEHLEGQDLRNATFPWSYERLLTLGIDVASGLGALHKEGVIHRDLSPGNIQQLISGRFIVMDPGFAKHTLKSGLTIGGQPGTPGFMTPEHVHSFSGPTPASDVFGCCSLVYLAATNTPPIPYEGDEYDYMNRLRDAKHTSLHEKRPDLPEAFVKVIERGLHSQSARRYRTGEMLSIAFQEV